jgi:hypothetical protein
MANAVHAGSRNDRAGGIRGTVDPFMMDPANFSLVLGGPVFQLWQRTRLAGDALQLLHRRIVVLTLLAWAPLLALSLAAGQAWRGEAVVPFLKDVEMQVRLLVAVPLLIAAELIVHRRMRPVVGQFVDRGLIPESAREQFHHAVASAMRLRNSVWAELLLITTIYVVGVGVVWQTQMAVGVASWRGVPVNGVWQPSLAGWWLGLVSLPVFQFLWARWYFRLFIWARFLWQVSRIDLKFMPMHPDRCGGLGFLAGVSQAFAPVLVAQGALLAGMIANRIFYAGATLPEFKVETIGLVAVMVFAVLGPLLVFSLQLATAKRDGLREHGILAQRYVQEYDRKWLRGGAPPDEPLVGSADIQSLADLGNSFEVVKAMRWAPFTLATVFQLGVTTLTPVIPLLLTMISIEELLMKFLQVIF